MVLEHPHMRPHNNMIKTNRCHYVIRITYLTFQNKIVNSKATTKCICTLIEFDKYLNKTTSGSLAWCKFFLYIENVRAIVIEAV